MVVGFDPPRLAARELLLAAASESGDADVSGLEEKDCSKGFGSRACLEVLPTGRTGGREGPIRFQEGRVEKEFEIVNKDEHWVRGSARAPKCGLERS